MLDTKLKNGNRAKWTGVVIVILASALFTALFPAFQKNAQEYVESYGLTYGLSTMESETFIGTLVRSNYVLYKNLMDKSGSAINTYDDLYLEEIITDVEEAPAVYDYENAEAEDTVYGTVASETDETDGYVLDYGYNAGTGYLRAILELYAQQLQVEVNEIQGVFNEDIATLIDYYALDKTTGTSLSNTALPIEKLLQKKDGGEVDMADVDDAYLYYVIMDYNASGYLQNISVRGRDADRLLKTVQVVENSSVGRLLTEREEVETFLAYGKEDSFEGEKRLTVSQRKPANATFIYAVTRDQLNTVPAINGYYEPVDTVFAAFLAGIFVLVMLLAIFKRSLLTGVRERKAPLEAVVVAAVFLFGFIINLMPDFVMYVADGDMREWLDTVPGLKDMSGTMKNFILQGFGFIVVSVIFGIWYVLCLEVSDVLRNGKEYVRTRVLTCVILRKLREFLQKHYRSFRAEIAQTDLGKDMNKTLRKIIFINFCLVETACMLWGIGMVGLVFYFLALYLICKKALSKIQSQYAKLLEASNSIAQGKLNHTFEEDFGVFESYKEELYKIQDGFKNAVDEEVKSQRMKTELITNVSHDLKTPLTAIITYIDLLKEEGVTEEQRKEYVKTLERKSLRLKVLIEDLFEVSKANSGTVKLEQVPVDICNLMRQAYLEQEEKLQAAGLQVRFTVPDEKIILSLDSQKTYRIFENLYTNIAKYALPDTRVFIVLEKRDIPEGGGVHIELKNISAQEIAGNPQELTERFVRGDASRNTEGSGLGLAIARSFTELQGGSFRIETDGDLFKVVIDW
ncbi:MAG: HAMP domain-containing histidine kinase [Muribaculaceae bacterium]|nr:HAMP domain-containing histidine kinase [Muribaculaceae bacterium]